MSAVRRIVDAGQEAIPFHCTYLHKGFARGRYATEVVSTGRLHEQTLLGRLLLPREIRIGRSLDGSPLQSSLRYPTFYEPVLPRVQDLPSSKALNDMGPDWTSLVVPWLLRGRSAMSRTVDGKV